MFGNLKGMIGGKEQGLRLHIRDDFKAQFVRSDIVDTFLVEKRNSVPYRAWERPYEILYRFPGFGSIPAGMVTLTCARDIFCDVFGQIEVRKKKMVDSVKEAADGSMIPAGRITEIVNNRCYVAQQESAKRLYISKQIMFLGLVAIILAIGLLIGFYRKQYGG